MGLFNQRPVGARAMDNFAMSMFDQQYAPQQRQGRGGMFGSGVTPEQMLQSFATAQAFMNGDYGAAGSLIARGQAGQAERRQAEQEAAARWQQQRAGYAALMPQGVSAEQVMAMAPQHLSATVADRLQQRQFGPEGGSIGTPGADGQMTYQQAPWQRQIGRTIVAGGANGGAPQEIYRGVEPVAVTEGGAVYGMYGDGSFANPGGAPAPAAALPSAPSGPVSVQSPEEARRLPPGTEFRTPDGRTMRVPGGAAPGQQPFRSNEFYDPAALSAWGRQ